MIQNVTVSYLQMLAHNGRASSDTDELEVQHVSRPTVTWYRFLYETIGAKWHWERRRRQSDAALRAIVHDSGMRLYVPYLDGTPIGMIELSYRIPEEPELVHFGLMPESMGLGFGPRLLQWTIDLVWQELSVRRFWLHTCTLDHPRALAMYCDAGFEVYRTNAIQRNVRANRFMLSRSSSVSRG